MNQITEVEAEQRLHALIQEFDHWRQTRTHASERIPETLWTPAVALSHVIPNSRVAKALKLSPSALKARRLGQPLKPRKAATTPAPAPVHFVELPQGSSSTVAHDTAERLSVELERADGARLRLRCRQGSTLDALVQRFLA